MLGCPRPQNPPSDTDRVLHHFFDVQRGGRGLTVLTELGFPAPDWALGRQGHGSAPGQNEYSLLDAREYQYRSLTAASRDARDKNVALLFRTLGHILHVLQDMAQPQHTRNDAHAECERLPDSISGGHSWYEQYVEDRTLRRAFPRRGGETPPDLVLGGYEPVSTRPYEKFFTESDRAGMADFSSRNFLSVGTNVGSSPECGGLVEPACQATAYGQRSQPFATMTLRGPVSGVVTLYTRAVVDQLTGQVFPNVALTSRSVWDHLLENADRSPKFTLNRFNYDAMADLLLPRAVGYSAGFLDTFFRSVPFDLVPDPSAPRDRVVLVNRLEPGEELEGQVELYRTRDDRHDRLAAWSLTVPPRGHSQSIEVPVQPYDADYYRDPGCFAVFRGRVGQEHDVVTVSREAYCPMEGPPEPPPFVCPDPLDCD
jgi:hypothetical protein